MKLTLHLTAAIFLLAYSALSQEPPTVSLPPGVQAVWDLDKAHREATSTRERICINGLWRWQPAADGADQVPTNSWGYFKVPACWPGIQDYMQSDYQTLYAHHDWKNKKLGEARSAWYERSITIPQSWAGRRISLDLEYLNSYAAVYVDGRQIGEARFPAGAVDISATVRPGATHVLSVMVVAMPLKAVMESYTDTNNARKRQGRVERRGLCGDAWLVCEPAGPRFDDVRVETSFRQQQITFDAALNGLVKDARYVLRARVSERGRQIAELTGAPFSAIALTNDRVRFSAAWKVPKLWDIHTPENQFDAELSLIDASGRDSAAGARARTSDGVLDTALPVRFGFRELWIQGRDFYLNGSRLYLSMVPLDNASIGAALATYDAAKESLLRLKSFGINFVYAHNYGCEPGSHLSFEEILRAADDTGMLVALSQPHFSAYDWKSHDADNTNGYATHAAFYVRVAGSHPSVVSYSMSHNGTGYNEDMNPQMMDGTKDPRDQWSARNAALALRCEAIVKRLDPARLVYHHSGGDLGEMYTINFYPNFVPSQELDDWFEHWSQAGNKPMLLVEFGAPFGWDWTMYRGWYNGHREFGSAAVPWEYCLAEWNAQVLGDEAYKISEREKRNLRWEAEQFRRGHGWYRWDYPFPVGDRQLDELHPVQAAYTADNWRAFRTWGLSGNSPWEHERFWKLREGFQHHRQNLPVDWDNLQRPGFSPDFIDRTYERFDLAYDRSDWVASPTAQALFRNNMPLLAWVADKPGHFTSKEHTFYAGETVEKEFIVINNSRVTVSGAAEWSVDLKHKIEGMQRLSIHTGEQTRVPLHFKLPDDLGPGDYHIRARLKAGSGEAQEDLFTFQVVSRPSAPRPSSKIALFDPPGQTTKLLAQLGVTCQSVNANANLSAFDVLFIGKGALTVDGPAPDISRVRDGLKVVVFEQTADVLEKRLGFRVEEYGLRQVWPRLAESTLLAGLTPENLRDWRGASTLLPSTLDYTLSPRYNGAPTIHWCGLEVTRLWRCGNWGNVASILIQKPPCGDFRPVLDGGYALQYSPLLEFREGRGLVLFCQMDVTGRTESEPAAEVLLKNIIRFVDTWRPPSHCTAVYAGESAGMNWLASIGVHAVPLTNDPLAAGQVLVVGPGSDEPTRARLKATAAWIKAGGRVLVLGAEQEDVNSFLTPPVAMQSAEHIATFFPPLTPDSLLAGVAPADVHNREPRNLPLVASGATVLGNGVLAVQGKVVFCQIVPWHFDATPEKFNQRRTFERTSFAVSRVLGNLGVAGRTPLLERFAQPASGSTNRCTAGLYVNSPTEWDDPYRFFRW